MGLRKKILQGWLSRRYQEKFEGLKPYELEIELENELEKHDSFWNIPIEEDKPNIFSKEYYKLHLGAVDQLCEGGTRLTASIGFFGLACYLYQNANELSGYATLSLSLYFQISGFTQFIFGLQRYLGNVNHGDPKKSNSFNNYLKYTFQILFLDKRPTSQD